MRMYVKKKVSLKREKRAFSELTAFVLITLFVVLASISVYFYAKSALQNNLEEYDRNAMEQTLKAAYVHIENIKRFDQATVSFPLHFSKGLVIFNETSLIYQSLKALPDNNTLCFSSLCYEGFGGSERLFFNLSDSYNFSQNFSLSPGYYYITFKNEKNTSLINVSFRN